MGLSRSCSPSEEEKKHTKNKNGGTCSLASICPTSPIHTDTKEDVNRPLPRVGFFFHVQIFVVVLTTRCDRHRGPMHIPAPKIPLPGHAESYRPPKEYLLTEEEQKQWEVRSHTWYPFWRW